MNQSEKQENINMKLIMMSMSSTCKSQIESTMLSNRVQKIITILKFYQKWQGKIVSKLEDTSEHFEKVQFRLFC